MYITILVKQVYWYISQVSGERLQDHWSSGFTMAEAIAALVVSDLVINPQNSLIPLFMLHYSASPEPFDTDKMAMEFNMQFVQKAFTEGQSLAFSFGEKKLLSVSVKSIEG